MARTYTRISLQRIQMDLSWNLHPWALQDCPEQLTDSFTSTGILNPPIVLETEQSEPYLCLCGSRRLRYAKEKARKSHLTCLVLPADTPAEMLLHIILEDQRCSGNELTLAEKARFLHIAAQYFSTQDIMDLFYEKLALKKKPSLTKDLRSLLQQEQEIVDLVHGGRLQEQMLSELLRLAHKEDRLALVRLFETLSLGSGKQKRLFQLIRDVAYKNQLSISAFLETREITKILKAEQAGVPQRIHQLGDLLQKQLQPDSLGAEKAFQQELKTLNLPREQTIIHSPSFEKDQVTLSIVFPDMATCKSYLAKNN